MLELEAALAKVLAAMPAPAGEVISLGEADGRVVNSTVNSPLDLPLFDNSSMDGYAVRSADLTLAKAESPVRLRLAGRVAAGESFSGEMDRGTCVRLFTGSPVPRGADAVVMQEDTRVESEQRVAFVEAVVAGENIRWRGEDVRTGQALLKAGERLGPGKLSLLAAVGLGQVSVGRRPVVGLIATGSELKEVETVGGKGERGAPAQLVPGQIYESNRLGLATLVRRAGGIPEIFPLVPDTLAETRSALQQAFERCEIVVTSGGVSVGEMDFIKHAFAEVGGNLEFWKVAIKPGRPFVFGRWQDRFLFGLPGNPVSAVVTFLLLVRPALLRWQGTPQVGMMSHPGQLAEPLVNHGARRHFMRVKVEPDGRVRSAGAQASHVLSSLASANGLVDVPPDSTLAAGTMVQVLRWE